MNQEDEPLKARRARRDAADLYPLSLKGDALVALVVGGGKVAERKINGLLRAGARVTVLSPALTEGVKSLLEHANLTWIDARWEEIIHDFPEPFRLVFAATNDTEINTAVAEWAHALGCLVNRVDAPEQSDFQTPASFILPENNLMVTLSTGGSNPGQLAGLRPIVEAAVRAALRDYFPRG